MVFHRMRNRMGHMVWQNQEALDQAGGQNHDDGKGDIRNQVAKSPPDSNKPKERDNRRKRRRKDGRKHAPRGIFRGRDRVLAQLTGPKIGMFTNNNRVINNDAKRQNEREEGYHIDRQASQKHQRHRRQHRNRDSRSDPNSGSRIQEEKKKYDDQPQSHKPVL